jgi:hypothetical protein
VGYTVTISADIAEALLAVMDRGTGSYKAFMEALNKLEEANLPETLRKQIQDAE